MKGRSSAEWIGFRRDIIYPPQRTGRVKIIINEPTTFCFFLFVFFPGRFRRHDHLGDGRMPGVRAGKRFRFEMVVAGDVPGFEAEWVGGLI